MEIFLDAELTRNFLDGESAFAVALSGGADSVCLLKLASDYAKEKGMKVYSLHLNHMIRGNESDRDEEFAREISMKLGAEFISERLDVPAKAEKSGKSLEEAARDARYSFFAKAMKEKGIRILMTAHNANDNAETLLLRLVRGTSGSGMCGIPKVREIEEGFVIRPILGVAKEEILAYLSERKIPYVTDSTNDDEAYPRNRIRKHVLPELQKINPSYLKSFERSMSLLREDMNFIDEVARGEEEKCISDGKLDMQALSDIGNRAIASRVLVGFANRNGVRVEASHVEEILMRAGEKRDFSLSLPGSMKLEVCGGFGSFCRDFRTKKRENFSYEYKLHSEITSISLDCGKIIIEVKSANKEDVDSADEILKSDIYGITSEYTVSTDSKIEEISVRSRIAGDKLDFGEFHKDVRRFMSEKKLPTKIRSIIPIIEDEKGILLVPFLGKAKRANGFGKYRYTVKIGILYDTTLIDN